MAGTLHQARPNRASRRKNNMANKPQPTVGININSVVAGASNLTIVFDQPVSLKGIPKYTTDVVGAEATAANMTNPTTLDITFNLVVAASTIVNIPYEDPAIRNSSGGFVVPTSFQV